MVLRRFLKIYSNYIYPKLHFVNSGGDDLCETSLSTIRNTSNNHAREPIIQYIEPVCWQRGRRVNSDGSRAHTFLVVVGNLCRPNYFSSLTDFGFIIEFLFDIVEHDPPILI